MFQTYTATTSPDTGAARLADLRQELTTEALDGFLVPRADAHQGNQSPDTNTLADKVSQVI